MSRGRETMKRTELNPITVNGVSYSVFVDHDGTFRTVDKQGDAITGKSLSELKTKIKRFVGTLNIPFTNVTTMDDDDNKLTFTDGVVIGVHSGNGNMIIDWGNGRREQARSYYGSSYLRHLESEERDELQRLYTAKIAAETAYDEYLRKLVFQLPSKEEQYGEATDGVS